jgi:methylenetetrahydrofolate reductase (NADPH)
MMGYGSGGASCRTPAISFEFFPPRNEAQAGMLEDTVARLAPYRPHYVSITYGAGGSSQERSRGTVAQMVKRGLPTVAHVTCAGAPRAEVAEAIACFRAAGVHRFVALRGDPPGGLSEPYRAHPDGFRDTSELVRALKDWGAAEVSVSAYPERHPQSADWPTEIATLRRKVDAGADRAITQFFYDNDIYEAYVERVRRAGIGIPVVPGIMPIHRFSAVLTFAGRCGASIPASLARRFDGLDPDSREHEAAAVTAVAEQLADLIGRGVDAFHVYTLNRANLAEAICRFCGVHPQRAVAEALPPSYREENRGGPRAVAS